ncbi:hypothetical protein HK097_008197 [Rhizophlyctis rosea]|uniref:GH26 domain-containing protein n=1 Tax=Rhizophlyctis rosea TaxID=64517 RepID=A0AAD5SJM1_9FUNG|nr:hypothetical protein HK097_008197 [Rhizophlyctis rosea]
MTYAARYRLCTCLFTIKATFSLLLALTALGGLSYRVWDLHRIGLELRQFNEWRTKPVVFDPTGVSCDSTRTGRARLEQKEGMMIGYSLDWKRDVPLDIASRVGGLRGAISNAFLQVNPDANPPYNTAMLAWHAQAVQQMGGILEITFEVLDLTRMTDAVYEQMAQQLREINEKNGVPVFLRWCHEMNGDWTSYGYKPALYIPSFRKMTETVRKYTNMTAMVWSPNIGIAYPFTVSAGAQSPPPTLATDPVNFRLLKTSTHNPTQIDPYDDPYLPYYPGDDVVDWVSLSLYYYPDQTNWEQPSTWLNYVPEMDFFASQLDGEGPWVDRVLGPDSNAQTRGVRAFYQRFSVARNKPMMLAESGAPLLVGRGGAAELDIKRAWWQQSVNATVLSRYPNLKAIVNFEEEKDNGDGTRRDWAYSFNPVVAKGYRDYLTGFKKGGGKIWFADELKFACDGSVEVV